LRSSQSDPGSEAPGRDGPRDACQTYVEQTKLLVGLASAFVVAPAAIIAIVSGREAIAKTRELLDAFLASEIALVASVLLGYVVLATIAGNQHKNRYDVNRLATRLSSLAQIGTYVYGLWQLVQFLRVVLASATLATGSAAVTNELFRAGDAVSAFESASATSRPESFVPDICAIRKTLEKEGSRSAIVIGRHDFRALSPKAISQFVSNSGLAQQRGDSNAGLLKDGRICPAAAIPNVLVLIGGPRKTPADIHADRTKTNIDNALRDDRRVEVCGLRTHQ
jgi:hypothetical protein